MRVTDGTAASMSCPLHSPARAQAPVLSVTRRLCRAVVSAASVGWSDRFNRKENDMTKTNDKPLYRVTFSRITGKDDKGNDVLARPKEIGAVWARKGDKKGGIITLDIIPTDLVNRQGVLFVVPIDGDTRGQAE